MYFLIFLIVRQYQCGQISCEFVVNWMSKTCSTVDREKHNKFKYTSYLINTFCVCMLNIWIKTTESGYINNFQFQLCYYQVLFLLCSLKFIHVFITVVIFLTVGGGGNLLRRRGNNLRICTFLEDGVFNFLVQGKALGVQTKIKRMKFRGFPNTPVLFAPVLYIW